MTKNELGKSVVCKMNVGPKFAQGLQYSPVTKEVTLARYFEWEKSSVQIGVL